MAIAVHIVNTPKDDAEAAYQAAWRVMAEKGMKEPAGRQSHTAWMVGDVLHVVDVWDTPDHLTQWMDDLAPLLQEHGMELDGRPEMGKVIEHV